jgi:hypothetical protein
VGHAARPNRLGCPPPPMQGVRRGLGKPAA